MALSNAAEKQGRWCEPRCPSLKGYGPTTPTVSAGSAPPLRRVIGRKNGTHTFRTAAELFFRVIKRCCSAPFGCRDSDQRRL
jgi:hypothetical protein